MFHVRIVRFDVMTILVFFGKKIKLNKALKKETNCKKLDRLTASPPPGTGAEPPTRLRRSPGHESRPHLPGWLPPWTIVHHPMAATTVNVTLAEEKEK